MALFTLDTDSVSSTGSSIGSLASQVSSLSSKVSGYDTNAEDFDFSSPKSVIAANIEACSVKVKNTATLIESVVSSHTTLQSQLKFSGSSSDTGTGDTSTNSSGDTSTDSNSNSDSGDSYSGDSGYSGGGGGGGGGGSSSLADGLSQMATEAPTEAPTEATGDKEIDASVNEVQYIYVDINSISDGDSKKLLTRSDFKYQDSGYATIGNRFVIACDQAYGKVGDVIDFVQKDGTVVSCVIGALTYSSSLKDKVSFFVNKEGWTSDSPLSRTNDMTKNTSKIINKGSVENATSADSKNIAADTTTSDSATTTDTQTTTTDTTTQTTTPSTDTSTTTTDTSTTTTDTQTTTPSTDTSTTTTTHDDLLDDEEGVAV